MLQRTRKDWIAIATLSLCSLFCYTWFFQGTGWNQDVQFDTTRALVERHSAEITPYASNTNDISEMDGKVFSNKPPGVALLAAPVYWIVFNIEHALGVAIDSSRTLIVNMHILTVAVSAIPGILVVIGVYVFFRRTLLTRDASVLAAAMAFGSLVWPYSGAMMSHLLVAAALFWAWIFISESPTLKSILAAGFWVGFAAACEYTAAPIAFIFFGFLVFQRSTRSHAALFCIGPLTALAIVLAYNTWAFGSPMVTSYTILDPSFTQPGLLFGQFDWPHWSRLYWITWHRMRGLFVCCPMFIVPLISILAYRNWNRQSFRAKNVVPLLVIANYVLLMLTFIGWLGGWATGPRYMIPALPFIWIYARSAFVRYRSICLLLIGLSVLNMFTDTAVQVFQPVSDAKATDPVSMAWLGFVRNQLAKSPDSYNLGMRMGLPGLYSILPIVAVLIGLAVMIARFPKDLTQEPVEPAGSGSPSAMESLRTTSLS